MEPQRLREALLTHQTLRSAARRRCIGSRTWSRASTGADVNSVREPAAQKISTGWPSQPQRPPGSMQCVSLLGTTHRPLLSQPHINPHRWPDGHCASFVQLTMVPEVPFLGPAAFVVWHSALPKAAKSQTTRVRICANTNHHNFDRKKTRRTAFNSYEQALHRFGCHPGYVPNLRSISQLAAIVSLSECRRPAG